MSCKTHRFGPLLFNARTGEYSMTCENCGHTETSTLALIPVSSPTTIVEEDIELRLEG